MAVGAAMDQEGFSFDSARFILSNQEEIEEKVKLEVLVPKLYRIRLITNSEREDLLYEPHLPSRRRTRLVDIIARTGNKGTVSFIECLRQADSHLPHRELAESLEKKLQCGDYTIPHQTSDSVPASPSSALPYHSHSQTPPYSQHHIHGTSTSAALGRSSQMPLQSIPTGWPSNSEVPHASAILSLEQLERSSPEFATIILGLTSELKHRKVTFDSIQRAILALLELDAIPIQLPSHVQDFPSLILHLRHLKMCHESDVDLLCKLLETLEQVDLRDRVRDYAGRLASTDVMQHRYQLSRPSHQHFVAFTFHNVPSLSLGEAYEIKHFISNLLHIPRHTFTLVGSEEGSIGLAWQIPVQFLKHVQSSLSEDEDARASLISSKHHLMSIELEVKEGSGREVAFTVPAGHISNEHVGMTACAGTSACDPYCVSSQEDAVSSTVDEFSSSIDSKSSKYRIVC